MIRSISKFGSAAALALILAMAMGSGAGFAQTNHDGGSGNAEAGAGEVRGSFGEQRPFVEIKLTKPIMERFIEAQTKIIALLDAVPANSAEEATLTRKVTSISKAAGFADQDAMDDVGRTIANVMSSIDPDTKKFVEPTVLMRREIEQVKISDFIPDVDKPKILAELNDVLAHMEPLKYPGNVDLVLAYFNQVEVVMQPVE